MRMRSDGTMTNTGGVTYVYDLKRAEFIAKRLMRQGVRFEYVPDEKQPYFYGFMLYNEKGEKLFREAVDAAYEEFPFA